MNTTTKLWWLCYKAIPLVFDNSLSYLEMLARLLEYVNNLKDALKELYEKVEVLDEKVERYYNDLLNRLDELETTLRNYIDTEIQNTKDELLEVIEENNTAMMQKIQDFIDYINGLIGEVKDVCFNPTNGHYENVCKILQDLYTSMQIDAMTVGEFDSTNYITVDYFDDFGLTAQEFDLRSKLLLKDFWKNVVDDKLNEIGDLEDLKTLSKHTLVDAINEVQDTTVNQSGNISSLITRMNTVEGEIDGLESGGSIYLNPKDSGVVSLPINSFVFQNEYIISNNEIPQSEINYNVLLKKLSDSRFVIGAQGVRNVIYESAITDKPSGINFFFPDEFYNYITITGSFQSTIIGTIYYMNGNANTGSVPLLLSATYNTSNSRFELNFINAFGQTNQNEYTRIYITLENSVIYLD